MKLNKQEIDRLQDLELKFPPERSETEDTEMYNLRERDIKFGRE